MRFNVVNGVNVINLILFLLPVCLSAQTGRDTAAPGIPLLAFKINAIPLLNPFKQAIAVSADLRLAPRFSVNAGAGSFLGSIAFANVEGESYTGLRLRAGVKYFPAVSKTSAFYVGIESKYHDINHLRFRRVFRQGQQYLELMKTKREVKTRGLAFCAGGQFYEGPKKRLLIEPFFGLGVAWHEVTLPLPPDAELVEEEEFISLEYDPGRSRILDVLLGIHVGVSMW